MKTKLSTIFFLFATAIAFAQCPQFQTNLNQFSNTPSHFQDVSIVELLDGTGDFITVATKFNNTFATSQLFIAKINGQTGTRIWVAEYVNVQSSRGFDGTVFLNSAGQEQLAVTGYINDGGNFNKTYIAIINTANGSIVSSQSYEMQQNMHSQGLNIIYTTRDYNGAATPGFMVAGYTNSVYDPTVANSSSGFILRTDETLNPLFTTITSSATSGTNDFDMVSDITETSDGFFITGSSNQQTGSQQVVLSTKLNDQGGILWQSGHEVGNDRDVGVDAYYDATTNQIFLLSYYSETHYFGVTTINNGNGAINPVRSYAYINSSELNKTGFKIIPGNNPAFANELIILGYERDGIIVNPDNTILVGNTTPFAVSINRLTGSINRSYRYPVPYKDSATYVDDFRFWQGQSPLIFHPEIGFTSQNSTCYVMAGYRSFGGDKTAIETFSIDFNINNVCIEEDIIINTTPIVFTPQNMSIGSIAITSNTVPFVSQGNGAESGTCEDGGVLSVIENNREKLKIVPNPASEIIRIEGLLGTTGSYDILTISGKIVASGLLSESDINISNLNAGVYFVKIKDLNNFTQNIKLIKR